MEVISRRKMGTDTSGSKRRSVCTHFPRSDTESSSAPVRRDRPCRESGILSELYQPLLSHYMRTSAAVTIGLVDLLSRSLSQGTLNQIVMEGNRRDGPTSLKMVLDRIVGCQERMIAALEKVEREAESRV